ncbi:MAG: hypothetical protein AAGF22_11145, partial [Pseudomonadota bacterium]
IHKSCFNLSSLTIKAGSVLEIDPATAREAIVVEGNLTVSNAHMQMDVLEGQRVALESNVPTKLTNRSNDAVEVVFLTLDPTGTARPDTSIAHYA